MLFVPVKRDPPALSAVFFGLNDVYRGLTKRDKERWKRTWVVKHMNRLRGVDDAPYSVIHPLVHRHPITGKKVTAFTCKDFWQALRILWLLVVWISFASVFKRRIHICLLFQVLCITLRKTSYLLTDRGTGREKRMNKEETIEFLDGVDQEIRRNNEELLYYHHVSFFLCVLVSLPKIVEQSIDVQEESKQGTTKFVTNNQCTSRNGRSVWSHFPVFLRLRSFDVKISSNFWTSFPLVFSWSGSLETLSSQTT